MIRAAIYARYSSDKQREESIEDQLYECNKYADKQGYDVVGNYCDYAMSGRSDDRPQFLRMIEDGREHRFEVIIVWKMDRFARNMEDQYYYEHLLSKAGVILESVKERVSGTGIEATTNKAVTALFAQIRSQQSAEDTMRGMAGKARKCQYIGYSWFGYGHDGDVITIDESEAEVVRQLHERYLAGESMKELGLWLMDEGYKQFAAGPYQAHNAAVFVGNVLKSDRYCGVYQWGKRRDDRGRIQKDEYGRVIPLVRVEGGIPAIVSWETKERVWERMKIRKKYTYESTYELTGKLYCAKCGKPLHGMLANGQTKAYRYYCCKGRTTTCFGRVGKDAIEENIAQAVRCFLSDESAKSRIIKIMCDYKASHGNGATIKAAKKELRNVNREINNLVKAVRKGMPWELARDQMAVLDDQKGILARRIAALEEELKQPLSPKDLRAFFDALSADYASDAEILRAFVSKAWLVSRGHAVATINVGTRDATLTEIEATLKQKTASPQVDDAVRLGQKWCPTNDSKRTRLYQLADWDGQVFPLESGIGILVHI